MDSKIDIKRMVLLALVAYGAMTLWNAWQREHAPKVVAQKTQAVNSDVPSELTAQLPHAATGSHATGAGAHPAAVALTTRALIHVKTDVLDAAIDLRGGQLVQTKLLKYAQSMEAGSPPVAILDVADKGKRLAVAQSGLLGKHSPDTDKNAPLYKATQKQFTLNGQKQLNVVLRWQANGLDVTKTYSFKKGQYAVQVAYNVKNTGSTPWQGQLYTQLKRIEEQPASKGIFYIHPYQGASISTTGNAYQKLPFTKLAEKNVDQNSAGGWLAMQQHYFLTAWIPNAEQNSRFYSCCALPSNLQKESRYKKPFRLGAVSEPFTVAPGKSQEKTATLYVGPETPQSLQQLAPHLDMTIDYGWFWWLSKPIFWVMKHIHSVLGNWGWAIIIVTILLKLLFYPLSAKSFHSMAKMKKLQPRIQALQERYKDDKQALGQKTIELYKSEKVNPLGGCLPMLVQIPFFIALYWVLVESVALRHAPFMLWIQDLSAKDPFYILPLLMGATMFVQQRMSPPPADPTQAKIMQILLPALFTGMFLFFPAGLVLYWTVNNGLSILQQWHVQRQVAASK